MRTAALVLLISGIVIGAHLEITRFQNNPGIYYEEIGKLHLYTDVWQVVMRISLKPFDEHHDQLIKYSNSIWKLCNHENICNEFRETTTTELEKITKKLMQVKLALTKESREKRGIIDGIGSVAKTLFGTMDHSDAVEINNQLKALEHHESILKGAVNKQTQIIESQLKTFNKSAQIIQENERALEKRLIDMGRGIDANINFTVRNIEMAEHFSVLNALISEYYAEVNDLLNYIIDLRSGILNPSVLSLQTLVKHLRDATPSLPSGLQFPILLDSENSIYLNKLFTLAAYTNGDSLITRITIPLVNAKRFDLIRVYPLPVKMNDTTYAYYEVKDKMFGIDTVERDYVHLTDTELLSCKEISKNYICSPQHAVYRITANSPCEIIMFNGGQENSPSCHIRIFHLSKTILIDISTTNTWLYVAPKNQTLTATCNGKPPIHPILQGSGKIQIKGKCIATSSEFRLEGNGKIESEFNLEYLPALNLSLSESDLKRAISAVSKNHTILLKPIIQDPNELDRISSRITEVKESLNDDGNWNLNHLVHYGTTCGIQIITIAIAIIVVIYILKKKRQRKSTTKKEQTNEAFEMAQPVSSEENVENVIVTVKKKAQQSKTI